jgi:hypothetical protein
LQALPSLQAVPLATIGFEQTPAVHTSEVHGLPSAQLALIVQDWHPPMGVFVHPLTALQASVVQALPSLQLRGVPAAHTPLWHVSAPSHASPSEHEVPFATAALTQPVVVLQLSVVHTLLSLQLRLVPAVQVPFWQVSLPLQTFPSPHEVPFRTGLWVQPKTGSHVSVVHGLLSLQLRVVPAVQVPL